jgi:hypothetical protein
MIILSRFPLESLSRLFGFLLALVAVMNLFQTNKSYDSKQFAMARSFRMKSAVGETKECVEWKFQLGVALCSHPRFKKANIVELPHLACLVFLIHLINKQTAECTEQ